jgi:hypothetical protein
VYACGARVPPAAIVTPRAVGWYKRTDAGTRVDHVAEIALARSAMTFAARSNRVRIHGPSKLTMPALTLGMAGPPVDNAV